MSLDVDLSAHGMRLPIGRDLATRAVRAALRAERITNARISVAFVSNARIAMLNRRHLGHAGPTDVISFGFDRATSSDPVIGDIYIAPDVARANAHAYRASVRQELVRLVVHGTLHVLGYDHPVGPHRQSTPMWAKQERIVRRVTRVVDP